MLPSHIPPWLLVVALGALFLGWYAGGNELMRRRARRLARWCRQVAEQLGSDLTIRWLTNGAFRIEVQASEGPFASASITGLVESLDVPMIWLWHRLRGRRDMVLLQLTLRRPPIWGLEIYRPGSLLSGDARQHAREEGWAEETLDGLLMASAGGALPAELARRMLGVLDAQRSALVRLAVRRRDSQLLLALNLPDGSLPPETFARLAQSLADELISFSTPAA